MCVLNMRLKRRGGGERALVDRADQAQALDDALVLQLGGGEMLGAGQLVEPEAAVAGLALHERVTERAHVARGDPHLGVHEDARVEADDVVALLDHRSPPGPLDVVLELDAQGPVVPHGVDAAVDLRGGIDEAAALGQRDDGVELLHAGAGIVLLGGGGRGGLGLVGHGVDLLGAAPAMAVPDVRVRLWQGCDAPASCRVRTDPSPTGSSSVDRVADLVDEGQGAGLALEHETGVAAHHRLHLRLQLGRHAQGSEGLHVEAPVGPEQLQRLE